MAALGSCGGGGDSREADAGPVRYYDSFFSFRDDQLIAVMVFDGGLLYGFYQAPRDKLSSDPYVYDGFFVGHKRLRITRRADGAPYYEGIEYAFASHSAAPVDITIETYEGNVFGATLEHGASTVESFGLSEEFPQASAIPADPATLEGLYAGTFRSVDADRTVTASVDAHGSISATSTQDDCMAQIETTPLPTGFLYSTTAILGAGCGADAGRYSGHAFQSLLTRNIYVLLTDGPRRGAFSHLFDPPS